MSTGTNTATLARGAFVFDRVEHQGWDHGNGGVRIDRDAPLRSNTYAGGKAERAVRQAARNSRL